MTDRGNKGFTLIELLVAFTIMLLIMSGFMYGLAFYMDYQLRTRVKNEASRMLKDITGFFESISYDFASQFSVPAEFDKKRCLSVVDPGPPPVNVNLCEFEYSDPASNTILDNDSDGIPDFFDPYDGDNRSFISNPRSVASWLSVYPASTGETCTVNTITGGTGTVNFNCVKTVAGRNIYAGVNVSSIIDDYGRDIGMAFGIIVWYFDPKNDKFVSIKSLVFKEYKELEDRR